jgi:mannose-6-phosphate isomerase
MTLPPEPRARLLADVLGRCQQAGAAGGRFAGAIGGALKLGAQYPGDIGVVASLLLNHVRLAPLEAVYLEAGRLHAYLSGTGVEIMASSDNVLRGGLTPKHVDVAELSSVLVFDSAAVGPSPTRQLPSGEVRYETPAPEFQLSRIELGPDVLFRRHPGGDGPSSEPRGPEILLCVEGQASVELLAPAPAAPRPLRRGQACFLSASSPGYALRGNGRVFRATVASTA